MKRAKIEYIKTFDGKIRIIKMEHIASKDEIKSMLGPERLREYLAGSPCFFRYCSNSCCKLYWDDEHSGYIEGGDIIPHDMFGKIIEMMKKAGERLNQISERTPEIKTVII